LLGAINGPLIDKAPVWRFDADVLRSDLERLIGHLPILPLPKDTSAYTLQMAQRILSGEGVRLPQLLSDIQIGKLPAAREPGELQVLAIWFTLPDLTSYQMDLRNRQTEQLMSSTEVCRILRFKPTMLKRLFGAGLLVPVREDITQHQIRRLYNRQDVLAFNDRYIQSNQVAALLGVSQLTIQAWVRSGRLPCIHDLQVDGTHAYRFDREALELWRQERMTFGEAMQILGVSKATLHRWVEQGRITPLDDMGGKQRWFAREKIEEIIGIV
jgi:excisionase family DNA binding protein